MSDVIPVLGMLTGIAIPLAVFFWQYLEGKERRATILEISKTIDDPDRLDELLSLLDEKKSEPTDSRRGGVITLFVGMGIYALGAFTLGSLFKGVGMLVFERILVMGPTFVEFVPADQVLLLWSDLARRSGLL